MMHAVAVDVGYGYTKAVLPDGRRAAFPSALAPAPEQGVRAALGATGDVVTVDGTDYLVGRAALDAGAQPAWAGDGASRRDYPLLVAAALALLQAPGGALRLYVGLPLAQYAPQRDALRDLLLGRAFRIAVPGLWSAECCLADVRVMPQGVGAYAAAVHDHPDLRRKPVGVVDVGYRTTDYVIVRHGPDGRANPVHWGTADVGGQSVAAACQAALARRGIPVGLAQVERALENGGVLWWRGEKVRLAVDAAEREVAAKVADAVQHAWRDDLDTLAAVVVTGGAGARLARHLPWPHVVVPQEPMFANARGYLLLGG